MIYEVTVEPIDDGDEDRRVERYEIRDVLSNMVHAVVKTMQGAVEWAEKNGYIIRPNY